MKPAGSSLTSGNRSNDEKRRGSGDNSFGKRSICGLVRDVFFASEEAQERPPLLRDVIADRPPQHRVARFERIEYCPDRRLTIYIKQHVTLNASERLQVRRKHDADHGSVCTSTESTAGKS